MKKGLRLVASLILYLLGTVSASAAPSFVDDEIWHACWSQDYRSTLFSIKYPYPIQLVIHNISLAPWTICVFDKLCRRSLYQGPLLHNYSIALNACADGWGRGSVALMNSAGEIWHFDATGDRIITLK